MKFVNSAGADARPLLVLIPLCGVFVWQAAWSGLVLYALIFFLPAFWAGLFSRLDFGVPGVYPLGSCLRFVLFWVLVKLALDLTALALDFDSLSNPGAAFASAMAQSVLLGLRLGLLCALGLGLTAMASPHALALAACWYLRPLLRGRAWQTGLAFASMLHFLPLIPKILAQAGQAAKLRGLNPGRPATFALILTAALRNLNQAAWEQATALAGRKLDRPEAWLDARPLNRRAWAVCGAVAALAWWAASLPGDAFF